MFSLLVLLGIAVCGGYVYLASIYCPVEEIKSITSTVPSPLSHLILDRDYTEQQGGYSSQRGGYVEQPNPQIGATINSAPSESHGYARQDKVAHEGGKAESWFRKFACEAKAADIALVFFTWCLVIATLWLGWATLKLWKAGENQMALIERNAADQSRDMQASISAGRDMADAAMLAAGSERAWMGLDEIRTIQAVDSLLNGVPFRQGLVIQVVWKNMGRSPALKSTVLIRHKIISFDDNVAPEFVENWGHQAESFPIGPGGTGNSDQVLVIDEEYNSLMRWKSVLIIYCAIKYNDVFNSAEDSIPEYVQRLNLVEP
jgi:hypothetical protein